MPFVYSSSNTKKEFIHCIMSTNPISVKSDSESDTSQKVDLVKICEFPEGAKNRVTVTVGDYKRLKFDTFLNDIIINFDLLHQFYNLPEESQNKIHIYPSTFYERLCSPARTVAVRNVAGLTKSEIMHLGVKRWTKQIDIFKKELLLIPICENMHWYLVAVIMPGLWHSRNHNDRQESVLVVFDSMGGSRDSAVDNIKNYLKEELKDKKDIAINSKDRTLVLYPSCPQQKDVTSCGIFILHYASRILSRLSFHLAVDSYDDLSHWDNRNEIETKRRKLSEVLLKLCDEQGHRETIEIPQVHFVRPAANDEFKTEKKEEVTNSQKSQEALLNYINVVKKKQNDFSLIRKYR